MTRISPPPESSDQPQPGWRVAGAEGPPPETFDDTPPHGNPVIDRLDHTPPQGLAPIAVPPPPSEPNPGDPAIGSRDHTPPLGLARVPVPPPPAQPSIDQRDATPMQGIPIAPAAIGAQPDRPAPTSRWVEPASRWVEPAQPPPPAWPAQDPGRPRPPAPTGAERVRPWWGMGDIALGIPFILGLAIVGAGIGIVGLLLSGNDDPFGVDSNQIPIALAAMSLVGQQLGQGIWPWVVSKWKGLGMASDWRWRFKPIDLAIGIATAVGALVAAGLVAYGVTKLLGIDEDDQTSNAEFLTDNQDSPWVIVLFAAVIIGAPISEELLFRGLILRAVEKRAGVVMAVVVSTVLFTVVHYIGGDIESNLVIFAAIATVGAILGVITVVTDRLAPAIIAHVGFNLVGAISALTQ